MKIKEVIPSLYEPENESNPFWENDLVEVNLYDLDDLIGGTMEATSLAGPDAFCGIARGVLEDILNAKRHGNADETHLLNFVQFMQCTEASIYFSSKGIFTESHDWLVYSLSEDLNYESETEFRLDWIDSFLRSKEPFIALNIIPTLIEWLNSLFYYSRHHGGLVEFATSIFEKHTKVLIRFLNTSIPPNSTEFRIVYAASQVLAWAINYKKDMTAEYAVSISDYFDKTSDRNVKKLIATQLTLGGAEFTKMTSSGWAELILSDFADLLVGHERMQILAKYYVEEKEKVKTEWVQMRDAIHEYIASLKSSNRLLLKYEKSRMFGVLTGLIIVCLEEGLIDVANNILTEFYEIKEAERISEKQLYIVCNYNSGVLYVSPSHKFVIEKGSVEEFVEVIYQTNRYLSSTIALNNYTGFKLEKPKHQGVPVIEEGQYFEEKLKSHYQLNKLSSLKLNAIDSMIIIPGFQHPIQGMMIKELGNTIPVCSSFEKSLSKRKINKVLLWCFGTRTSDLEISLTKKMLESATIEVEAINILEVKRDDFILKYNSPEYDLVWVGTHGNYNHFLPHLSKIDLHPDGEMELSELYDRIPETEDQRMLFLNICDGATASTLNAIYDIGLGASLCNRNQAVLSHIWMVKIESSFIYGVLYAHFIIKGDDFYVAYENVVKSFIEGKEHIRQLLSPYFEIEPELVDFIDRLDDNIHENIYYWGSGVYYQ